MNTKLLRSKLLSLAIAGRLVPQDPADEPAAALLRRINPKFTPQQTDSPLPTGWTACTLEDIVEIKDNLRQPINSAERNKRVAGKKDSELYPYYGATGQVGYIDKYLIDGKYLLLGEDGAPFLDKMANKAYIVEGKCWVNNHAHVLLPHCNTEYLCIYLNQFSYYSYVTGSTRLKLTQASMKKMPVLVPPLAEQERIVKEVERWFACIEQMERSREALGKAAQQTKRTLLSLAIAGRLVPQDHNDEPAIALLRRINPKFTPQPTDEPLPPGWTCCKLNDYVKLVTDFVASGSFASLRENVKYYREENYAVLVRTLDLQNNFRKDLVYTDKHGYEFLNNSNLFGGELVLPNVGSIGKVFRVPHLNRKMTLAPNSIMLRFHDETHIAWFYYLFSSSYGQSLLKSITSSTAQAKFNKTGFRNLVVPLPPLAEQERIVRKVEDLFAVLDRLSPSAN